MANCTGRITAAGRAILVKLLKDTDNPPAIWIGWGSGTVTIADTDTGLGFEVDRKRGTATRNDADTFTVTGSFVVVAGGAFSEMGLFDALSGGTMLYRGGYSTDSPVGVYDVESKTIAAGDILNLSIEIDVKSTSVSVTTVGRTKATDVLSEKPVA